MNSDRGVMVEGKEFSNPTTGFHKTKPYRIKVMGCDDTTEIQMHLTHDEFLVVDKVASLVTSASDCNCQPTMSIEEIS